MARGTNDILKPTREWHNDRWKERTGWPRGHSYFSGWQEITALTTKMYRTAFRMVMQEEVTPEFILDNCSDLSARIRANEFAKEVSDLFFKYADEMTKECFADKLTPLMEH